MTHAIRRRATEDRSLACGAARPLGGGFRGFSADVGLLPDSNVGFVVLTNTISSLRSIAARIVAGRTIFQMERVEVNVELPPETFTLEPSTSPGSGR